MTSSERYSCVKCGKIHGMQIENRITGECTPLYLCYDCIFSGIKYRPPSIHNLFDEGTKDLYDRLINGVNMYINHTKEE